MQRGHCAAVAFVLFGCGPATARAPSQHFAATFTPRRVAVCDSGAFRVTAGTVLVGREEFAIECHPSGVSVRVHTTVTVSGQPSDLRIKMALDTMLRPREVTVSGTAGGEKVADTLSLGRHDAVLRRDGQTRVIAAVPEASFVGSNFHTGLWMAIGRYDLVRGGKQDLPVFPNHTLTMEPLAGEPRAYRVIVGPTSAVAWLDDRDRPVALLYRKSGLHVLREGTEFAGAVSRALAFLGDVDADRAGHGSFAVGGAHAEEVSFSVGPIRLAGSLLRPLGPGPFPAVILISGSGPQDRDGRLGIEGLAGYTPFRELSAALVARGVSVLRFDDRGVGKSGGAGTTSRLTTWDVVSDVNAAILSLRARQDTDPRRIGLLGHSEGALVALLVAANDPGIAALALLAAPGTRGDTLLRAQLQSAFQGSAPGALDSATRVQEDLFTSLRRDTTNHSQGLDWLRTFIDLTPAEAAGKVRVPVGIFQGALDTQVLPPNADALARLLRRHAHPDVTVMVFDSLNHLMLPARTGAVREYASLPVQTLDSNLLDRVGTWLSERLAAGGASVPAERQ